MSPDASSTFAAEVDEVKALEVLTSDERTVAAPWPRFHC